MPVFAAIAAAKKSGQLDGLLNQGAKLLGDLTGCKVKPKGTDHQKVYDALPKFFFWYGTGTPGSKAAKAGAEAQGGLFDIISGLWIRDLESALSKEDRKKLEQTARQKCETLTGDWGYYAKVRAPITFKGLVRLSDGEIYDAATYGVQGGTYQNPLNMAGVRPKGEVQGALDTPVTSGKGGSDFATAGLKLAGAYLAYKTFAG